VITAKLMQGLNWADPAEWARMYRGIGFQVVPAMSHRENRQQWKRTSSSGTAQAAEAPHRQQRHRTGSSGTA
jgi:hypothetical protein